MDSWLALAACGWQKGSWLTSFLRHREKLRVASASNSLPCNWHKAFLTIALEAETLWAGHAWMMQSLSCAWFVFAFGRCPPYLLEVQGHGTALLQELPVCMDSSSAIFSSTLLELRHDAEHRGRTGSRTSAVKSMEKMLRNALAFNQDIDALDV